MMFERKNKFQNLQGEMRASQVTWGKESACQCRRHRRQVLSLGQEDLLQEEMQPSPLFLPRESHGQRSLVGYSPLGHKESDTNE